MEKRVREAWKLSFSGSLETWDWRLVDAGAGAAVATLLAKVIPEPRGGWPASLPCPLPQPPLSAPIFSESVRRNLNRIENRICAGEGLADLSLELDLVAGWWPEVGGGEAWWPAWAGERPGHTSTVSLRCTCFGLLLFFFSFAAKVLKKSKLV